MLNLLLLNSFIRNHSFNLDLSLGVLARSWPPIKVKLPRRWQDLEMELLRQPGQATSLLRFLVREVPTSLLARALLYAEETDMKILVQP